MKLKVWKPENKEPELAFSLQEFPDKIALMCEDSYGNITTVAIITTSGLHRTELAFGANGRIRHGLPHDSKGRILIVS